MPAKEEITIIDATKQSWLPSWNELIQYRHLLYSLAWKDIRVKYAQTFMGLSWAIVNPLVNLFILWFVFTALAKIETEGLPPVLFIISGLCVWNYFSMVLTEAGSSILKAEHVITKLYFPRLFLPLSKAISCSLDFIVSVIMLAIVMIYYRVAPSSNVIFLPIFILLTGIAGLTGGLWFSSLTVRFRDFIHVIPMLLRIAMYVTPVAFPASVIPERFQWIYFCNPIAGIVEGFRWCLFDTAGPNLYMFVSIGLMLLLFVLGLFYYKKIDKDIADFI